MEERYATETEATDLNMRLLKTIDRYIIRQFLGTFFFILALVMSVAVVFDISEKTEDFAKMSASLPEIITDYYFNFVVYYPNLFSGLFIFLAVLIFTAGTEFFPQILPRYLADYPITDNVLLAAIYAGLVGGIGGGMIYGAGATLGGTGIIGRIIQTKTGVPLSQVYLFVDGGIILTAGVVFGWSLALYAMLTLLLNGLATDYVLEGPSRARTAFIITNQRDAMIGALSSQLGRGVSHWEILGGYTNSPRTMVLCTIYRPQVNDLKRIVSAVDPTAFVTIGMTQQALGEGFTDLRRLNA